jgi:Rrf2 family protein
VLRISRETDYAIRILLALAKYPGEEIIPSAVIREEMEVPESISLQIVSRLAHLNFINTYPGRNGGIQLAVDPVDIDLHQVISDYQGPLILSECLDDAHQCNLASTCPVQKSWINIQGVLEKELKSINFQDLVEDIPERAAQKVE